MIQLSAAVHFWYRHTLSSGRTTLRDFRVVTKAAGYLLRAGAFRP